MAATLGLSGSMGSAGFDGAGVPLEAPGAAGVPVSAVPAAPRVFVPARLQLAVRAHILARLADSFGSTWWTEMIGAAPRPPWPFSPATRSGSLLTPAPAP